MHFTPTTTDGIVPGIAGAYQSYLEQLYSNDLTEVLKGIKEIKNLIIGNNKRKDNFIALGSIDRFICLIKDPNVSTSIKLQATIVLGSLAKGIDANAQSLLNQSIMEAMCHCLLTEDLDLYEAAIRCLRTVMTTSGENTETSQVTNSTVVSLILRNINRSTCTQECTCEILQHYCRSHEQQSHLLRLDILSVLANLLESSAERVKFKALVTLSAICYKNNDASEMCMTIQAKESGNTIIEILIRLLSQTESNGIQLYSARCLSFMFRANVLSTTSWNGVIARKVLPCLIRMCDDSCTYPERICAAESVAYLTEVDATLQRLSYICEQFPLKLEAFFRFPVPHVDRDARANAVKYEQSMVNAGFVAYASLLSNDEDLRKRVATEALVSAVAEVITSGTPSRRISALKCFLSLSRSIHLLRTTIEDAGIWKVILKLMQEPGLDMIEKKILSSITCNMTLDVSPSKNALRSAGLIDILVEWVKVNELKLNSVWCLMNMTFQAESPLKLEILEKLGFDMIRSLVSDGDCIVVLRSLGLLRNICHNADEKVLSHYGIDIIRICNHVLTTFATAGVGDPATCVLYESIRAHTICILSGLASVKDDAHIQECLEQELDSLQLIISYLSHFHADLQLATATFLYNFIANEDADTEIRHSLLLKGGTLAGLRQLHSTNDRELYEKIENTLQLLHNK